ncbi:hypothetical protein [Lederbergia lenta]|uniref:hypothetical protein n=1 Tax=Lederbergia lenta TaxID=1467 RepID=UPI00203C425D|nr:hypothetical protein [Lederbergia lenta]MCM3111224.1 hypothetical protein [Lederbergia lenta]
MNSILILLIIFIIAMFLCMLAAVWFMNFLTRKYIGEKHMVLDELTKGEVPESWSQTFQMKCKKYKKEDQQEKMLKLQKLAKKTYLRKLNRLVDYVQKTKLIESEETRTSILADLEKTRQRWKESKAHEVCW